MRLPDGRHPVLGVTSVVPLELAPYHLSRRGNRPRTGSAHCLTAATPFATSVRLSGRAPLRSSIPEGIVQRSSSVRHQSWSEPSSSRGRGTQLEALPGAVCHASSSSSIMSTGEPICRSSRCATQPDAARHHGACGCDGERRSAELRQPTKKREPAPLSRRGLLGSFRQLKVAGALQSAATRLLGWASRGLTAATIIAASARLNGGFPCETIYPGGIILPTIQNPMPGDGEAAGKDQLGLALRQPTCTR